MTLQCITKVSLKTDLNHGTRWWCTVHIFYRTLSHAAHIISERKNVHHSIINGLDSHDAVEQEAAIFAAFCFAGQSKWVVNISKGLPLWLLLSVG